MTKINTETIKKLTKENLEFAKDMKNYLHENPELSSKEFETKKILIKECEKLGLKIEEVKDSTGFVAILDTGKKGETVGIRTDIDALPINEDKKNLKGDKAYVSKNDGVMHACGHDAHMSIALTSARILTSLKDKLRGKIYFIFEEGEETGAGIDKMVKHLEDVSFDAIYGNHVDVNIPLGEISIPLGPVMAGCAGVDFDVKGVGGHGSRPDLLNSPIDCLISIVNNLNQVFATRVNPKDSLTFGIGSINAGHASNVIPDKANLKATIRFFEDSIGEAALEKLKNVAKDTAKVFDCKVNFNDYTRIVAYPVRNDEDLAKFARASLKELFPKSLREDKPSFGGESFYGYRKLCPTVFARIGVKNEGKGYGAGAHTEKFDIDNDSLYYAVASAVNFLINFLES